VRSALTRVARTSPRIDSDFLGSHLKPAPSRAVEILCPHMGAGGPTAKLVGKSAEYTWLFLARVTRPSTIRFIGILLSRSDGQSQDGSLSLPSGNCLAASKQRRHY